MLISLDHTELSIVAAALTVAAEAWDKDAETCKATSRVHAQFKQQAEHARELVERLEEEL